MKKFRLFTLVILSMAICFRPMSVLADTGEEHFLFEEDAETVPVEEISDPEVQTEVDTVTDVAEISGWESEAGLVENAEGTALTGASEAQTFYWWIENETLTISTVDRIGNSDYYGTFIDGENTNGVPWKSYDQHIKRIKVGGVTSSDIVAPTNMAFWFAGQGTTTEMDFRYLNTENVVDMHDMFHNCISLSSVDLSGFNTSKVTDMRFMFTDCQNLTTIDLSSFDTGNVTNMRRMFWRCAKLTELDLSNFDTRKVTNMEDMFFWCFELRKLNLSGFNTCNVENMGNMFDSDEKLEELDISNFDTKNCRDFGGMFKGCKSLRSLDASKFDTRCATNMREMFVGCSSLSELDVSGFKTGYVSTMNRMFAGCKNLTELDVSGFDTSRVGNMDALFNGCENVRELNLSSFNTSKVNSMWAMFNECRSLTELDLSNFDTSSLSSMDKMFYNCSNLEKIDISGFDTRKMTESNRDLEIFTGCNKLSEIKKGDNTLLIGKYMLPKAPDPSFIPGATGFWYDDDGNEYYSSGMGMAKAGTYRAWKTYKITWEDDAGNLIGTTQERYGIIPTPPKPYKNPTEEYRYTFVEWTPALEVVTGPGTYTGLFEKTERVYAQITWQDDEGNVIDILKAEYGTVPEHAVPVKAPTAEHSYVFTEWNPAPVEVTGDAAYKATFSETLRKYTITVKANDVKRGSVSVSSITDVPYGSKIVTDGGSLTAGGKTATAVAISGFKFSAWSGLPAGQTVTGDVTVTAVFASAGGGSSSGGGRSSGGSSGGGGGGGGSVSKKSAVSSTTGTFSKFWYEATAGIWKIKNSLGQDIVSAWLCDDAVTANGQNIWYLMNTDGTMLAAGLVQDMTGNYYSLETTHNGYYGMLRYKNGTYDCNGQQVYLEFSQNHDGTFGAVTNAEGLRKLKEIYGVTPFGVDNGSCRYTSTF